MGCPDQGDHMDQTFQGPGGGGGGGGVSWMIRGIKARHLRGGLWGVLIRGTIWTRHFRGGMARGGGGGGYPG